MHVLGINILLRPDKLGFADLDFSARQSEIEEQESSVLFHGDTCFFEERERLRSFSSGTDPHVILILLLKINLLLGAFTAQRIVEPRQHWRQKKQKIGINPQLFAAVIHLFTDHPAKRCESFAIDHA